MKRIEQMVATQDSTKQHLKELEQQVCRYNNLSASLGLIERKINEINNYSTIDSANIYLDNGTHRCDITNVPSEYQEDFRVLINKILECNRDEVKAELAAYEEEICDGE